MCIIVKSLSSHTWPISLIQWACFLQDWALESRQHNSLLCSNSVTCFAVSGLAINSTSLVAICRTKINLLVVTCCCSTAYDLSEESVLAFVTLKWFVAYCCQSLLCSCMLCLSMCLIRWSTTISVCASCVVAPPDQTFFVTWLKGGTQLTHVTNTLYGSGGHCDSLLGKVCLCIVVVSLCVVVYV